MRIVFIHGINNQGNTADTIAAEWSDAIRTGWEAIGAPPKPFTVEAAFYGKILADKIAEVQAMGGGTHDSTLAFEFLQIYQEHLGLTDEQVDEAARQLDPSYDRQEMGIGMAMLVKLAGAIAGKLPNNGKTAAGLFLGQAITYIDNKGVRDNIHNTVEKQVFKGKTEPAIVVSHSLGTVVAHNLLGRSAAAAAKVPLLVTLGSPLAIGMMDKVTPVRSTFPTPPIARWVNARRKDDFVPLDMDIDKATLGFDGVENIYTTMNADLDPHSIVGYLQDPKVARLLHQAL